MRYKFGLLITLASLLISGCDSSSSSDATANPVSPGGDTRTPSGIYFAGRVTDPTTGSPVAGLRVQLKRSRLFTHTDANGKYVISRTPVAGRIVAGRAMANDSTQTYVDTTTPKSPADTAVAPTVVDSIVVSKDTTDLATTPVRDSVDSIVPVIRVVQRNFGGSFQPYAPAGVRVWLDVSKDSGKTVIAHQKLGLLTAMSNGTIPGYSGYVYFKYDSTENYEFTAQVSIWNKDSTVLMSGSDLIGCDKDVGDVQFPTLNGSGYITPAQFLLSTNDSLRVDSLIPIKLAQIDWGGVTWHQDTGATVKFTYKYPSKYVQVWDTVKASLFSDTLAHSVFADTGLNTAANGGYEWVIRGLIHYSELTASGDTSSLRKAPWLGGKNFLYFDTARLADSTRADSVKVLHYVSDICTNPWNATTSCSEATIREDMDSLFRLTVTWDSLTNWAAGMLSKNKSGNYLMDSAIKKGYFVFRDSFKLKDGTLVTKTKDSTLVSKFGYYMKSTEPLKMPLYQYRVSYTYKVSKYDSLVVSAKAPAWALKDTTGPVTIQVPKSVRTKMDSAEALLVAQVPTTKIVVKDTLGLSSLPRQTWSPSTKLPWDPKTSWAGMSSVIRGDITFTLGAQVLNSAGTKIGNIDAAKALRKR